MGIKQLNGVYVKAEDRLLIRFNTNAQQEYRLWFTRLMSMSFLESTNAVIQRKIETQHAPRVAQVIQEFQKEGVKRTADFQTPYQPAPSLPLGAEPMLVTAFSLKEKEGLFFVIFRLSDGKNINLTLPSAALQSIVVLIEQLIQKAAWQSTTIASGTTTLATSTDESTGKKMVH